MTERGEKSGSAYTADIGLQPAGADAALLLKSAKALVRAGAFDEAGGLFERGLELDPVNGQALLGLSALHLRRGERKLARQLLELAITVQPIKAPARHDDQKPTVVRTRCVDSGAFRIIPDRRGGFKQLFKGGHFSIENLLDDRRINLYVANLLAGSTNALEQCPKPDILINTIACADLGQRSLSSLSRLLGNRPLLPVINRPAAVARTTRDQNYTRLNALEHVRFPRTERLPIDAGPSRLARRIQAAGFDFPLILRPTGRQTGRGTRLCQDRAALRSALEEAPPGGEVYVIEYVDCRDSRGFYRKARAFFIDGQTYPVAYLTSDHWQIHSNDRYQVMSQNPSVQREEQSFLLDPRATLGADAYGAPQAVGRHLELDFAGVDFTVTPDGNLFVFEANPAMRHNFDHASAFPYTRRHLQRISAAFDTMVHARISKGRRTGVAISPLPGA